MEKKRTFRKRNFTIARSKRFSYGHYEISFMDKGKNITILTTNSEAYENLDSELESERRNAARAIYHEIINHINLI